MSDVVDLAASGWPLDRPRDQAIAEVASVQGGVISHQQLLAVGPAPRTVRNWVASGRLHRLFRGVYAVGHEAITDKGRLMAPALAYGPDGLVSHRSATDWWGIARTSRAIVDITVPGRSKADQRGIELHLVRRLDPRDVTVHEGVPITTVARTLLDYAEVVPRNRLKRAIEEADRLRMFDGFAVQELLARSPGRRGIKPLRDLLSDFVYDEFSREELEALFFDLCKEAGLPLPTMNAVICGYQVDAYWPGTNRTVEVDSRAFHLNARAFEDDRIRDAELMLAGYRVLPVTHRQLTKEPQAVARRIRALLADPQPLSPSPHSAEPPPARALPR